MRKILLVLLILALAVALGTTIVLVVPPAAPATGLQKKETGLDTVYSMSHVKFGRSNAPILVVEFYDLLCPFCALAHVETADKLRELIGMGEVEYVLYDFLVHYPYLLGRSKSEAEALVKAHELLWCAYDKSPNLAWEIIDEVYRTHVRTQLVPTQILLIISMKYRGECGYSLDVGKYFEVAESMGVDATPTYVIYYRPNGTTYRIVGADVERLLSLLNSLTEAKR